MVINVPLHPRNRCHLCARPREPIETVPTLGPNPNQSRPVYDPSVLRDAAHHCFTQNEKPLLSILRRHRSRQPHGLGKIGLGILSPPNDMNGPKEPERREVPTLPFRAPHSTSGEFNIQRGASSRPKVIR